MADIQTPETGTDRSGDKAQRRWLRYTILAAAAVIVVIVAVTLFDGSEESSPVDLVDSPDAKTIPFPTGRFVGTFRAFEFDEDGTFGFFLSPTVDHPTIGGTYSVDGDLYTEMTSNYGQCPFPGTYAWTYDGENLSFQLVGEDACGVRVAAYDGQTYTRSQ